MAIFGIYVRFRKKFRQKNTIPQTSSPGDGVVLVKFDPKEGLQIALKHLLVGFSPQLMVNWWFGLVVWDSRDTPK